MMIRMTEKLVMMLALTVMMMMIMMMMHVAAVLFKKPNINREYDRNRTSCGLSLTRSHDKSLEPRGPPQNNEPHIPTTETTKIARWLRHFLKHASFAANAPANFLLTLLWLWSWSLSLLLLLLLLLLLWLLSMAAVAVTLFLVDWKIA